MAERDVGDWSYARFLKDKAGTDTRFAAEIVDISRGGMRVRLVDNGAIAFIPAPSYTLCAMNWFGARKTARTNER
ncbi:S1 RNA-binding domain-containing protein [Shigella flexneri]